MALCIHKRFGAHKLQYSKGPSPKHSCRKGRVKTLAKNSLAEFADWGKVFICFAYFTRLQLANSLRLSHLKMFYYLWLFCFGSNDVETTYAIFLKFDTQLYIGNVRCRQSWSSLAQVFGDLQLLQHCIICLRASCAEVGTAKS